MQMSRHKNVASDIVLNTHELYLFRFEPATTPFSKQLKLVEDFLDKSPSDVEVVNKLGTEVAALYSVPTAIHCFIRAQSIIPGIAVCTSHPFLH